MVYQAYQVAQQQTRKLNAGIENMASTALTTEPFNILATTTRCSVTKHPQNDNGISDAKYFARKLKYNPMWSPKYSRMSSSGCLQGIIRHASHSPFSC